MNKKTSYIRYIVNKPKIDSVVINNAQKNKQVIYGSVAMNKQLSPIVTKKSGDFDVYSKTPRKSADTSQKQMDKVVGADDFYHKMAIHSGTWKVLHEGPDGKKRTEDDVGIVDYTKIPRQIKTVSIQGTSYERLDSIAKGKRKTLRDKKSRYRHEKDKDALTRIGLSNIINVNGWKPTTNRRKR